MLVTAALVVGRPGFVVDRAVGRAWSAVLGVAAAATAFSPDPLLSVLGDPVRLMGLAGLALVFGAFLAGTAAGPSALRPVLGALLVGAVLVVSIALFQFANDPSGRPTGSLGNAAFLGGYLCLVLPVAASRFLATRRDWWPGVLFVGSTLALLASTTRGAWIGAAVGLALLAGLWLRRAWPVLAIAAIALIAVVAPVRDRDTLQGRFDTWTESVDVVADRPVLGWGPEGFRRGFASEVSDDWVRTYQLEQIPDRAHNRLLDAAVTGGALGALADLALLALAAFAICRGLRSVEHGSGSWWAVAGVAGGLAGYVTQSLFLFETFDLSVIAWLLAGLAMGVGATTGTRNVPSRSAVKFALAGVVLVGFGVVNLIADRVVEGGGEKSAAGAVAELERAASLRPRALSVHLLAAHVATRSDQPTVVRRVHRMLAGWEDPLVQLRNADVLAHLARLEGDGSLAKAAVAKYERNLALVPTNGPAWLGLGATRFRLGQHDGARSALRRAAYLMPHRAEPALNLAALAFAGGDDASGCDYLRTAMSLGGAPPLRDLRRAAPVDCRLGTP